MQQTFYYYYYYYYYLWNTSNKPQKPSTVSARGVTAGGVPNWSAVPGHLPQTSSSAMQPYHQNMNHIQGLLSNGYIYRHPSEKLKLLFCKTATTFAFKCQLKSCVAFKCQLKSCDAFKCQLKSCQKNRQKITNKCPSPLTHSLLLLKFLQNIYKEAALVCTQTLCSLLCLSSVLFCCCFSQKL